MNKKALIAGGGAVVLVAVVAFAIPAVQDEISYRRWSSDKCHEIRKQVRDATWRGTKKEEEAARRLEKENGCALEDAGW